MDLRQRLFQYRSYIPIPFLIVMIVSARPTLASVLVGGAMVVAGEFLRLWGVAIAGSETRTTDRVGGTYLVTTGPFAHVRNPLYLGNIIVYVGFGIMSMALFPWLPAFALVFFSWEYSLIVSLEEEHLESRFQSDYLEYKQSVPRFLPSPKRFIGGGHAQPAIDWKRGLLSEKRSLQAIALLTAAIVVVWQIRG
jgi:protein-S-isoprenylcysteine O-methyltransferase Ste14